MFPQIRLYCLFFVYVSFGEEKNKDENTADVALIQYPVYTEITVRPL